jgi:hypothetical protein
MSCTAGCDRSLARTPDVTLSLCSPPALHAASNANVQHDCWAHYLPLPPFLCLVIVLLSAYADRFHSNHVILFIFIVLPLKKSDGFGRGLNPGPSVLKAIMLTHRPPKPRG